MIPVDALEDGEDAASEAHGTGHEGNAGDAGGNDTKNGRLLVVHDRKTFLRFDTFIVTRAGEFVAQKKSRHAAETD